VSTRRDVSTTDVATGFVSNPKGDYSSFNPRLGALYALSATNELFASIGRLYEAPTNFELTDEVRGNNTLLDAMHGNVVEVGMRGSTPERADAPRWNWDLSVYYARIHDEILSVDDPFARARACRRTSTARRMRASKPSSAQLSLRRRRASHRAAGEPHVQRLLVRQRSGPMATTTCRPHRSTRCAAR
jgi:iron complex outermembrane receptor protein